jgi:hypothetical protein
LPEQLKFHTAPICRAASFIFIASFPNSLPEGIALPPGPVPFYTQPANRFFCLSYEENITSFPYLQPIFKAISTFQTLSFHYN